MGDSDAPRRDNRERSDLPLRSTFPLRLESHHAEPLAYQLFHWYTRMAKEQFTLLWVEVPGAGRVTCQVYDDGFFFASASSESGERHGREWTSDQKRELERLGWQFGKLREGYGAGCSQAWEPPNPADTAQMAALTLIRVHGLNECNLEQTKVWTVPIWWPDGRGKEKCMRREL